MAKYSIRPTDQRTRQAANEWDGGIERLETGQAGKFCHGVRYPLLVDYLRDKGLLAPDLHDIAMRVRVLYERTTFRAHVTTSYEERASRTVHDPEQETADDVYRHLDQMVLLKAGRPAWVAFRSIVIEDRMTRSYRLLPVALREAERRL